MLVHPMIVPVLVRSMKYKFQPRNQKVSTPTDAAAGAAR
jgi:hypothetical protein